MRAFNVEPELISHAIEVSCQSKADVVSQDERESGVRAILNLGHTFGHAIETHTGYGSWLHGEAVAAGMVMAARMSQELGNITERDVDLLRSLLRRAALPVDGPVKYDLRGLPAVDAGGQKGVGWFITSGVTKTVGKPM